MGSVKFDHKNIYLINHVSQWLFVTQIFRNGRTCAFFFGNCSEFGNFVITLSSYRDSLDGGLLPCLRTSCDRHHDLVNRYGISVSQITTDWHGWLDIYFCKPTLTVNFELYVKAWSRLSCICGILYFKLNGVKYQSINQHNYSFLHNLIIVLKINNDLIICNIIKTVKCLDYHYYSKDSLVFIRLFVDL
jgi:hypothetical protein